MIKHGQAPFLECSSRGDRRFSAFSARVNGVSIEEQYQAAKMFEGGVTGLYWSEAKGRRPMNVCQVQRLYSRLWDQYIFEHPELLRVLCEATGLSDMFGQAGHVCQATELWQIRGGRLSTGSQPLFEEQRS